MNVFIRQLTGIRFIAAAWVLLYHLQVPLNTLHLLVPVFSDTLRVGRLGVDLFFALSGFIQPGVQGLMTRRVGPSEQGRLQGASSSIQGVTGLIGPGLFTSVFAWSVDGRDGGHMPGIAVLVAAALLLAGLAVTLLLRDDEKAVA